MSNDANLLAELGLAGDNAAAETTAATTEAAAPVVTEGTQEAEKRAPRVEVKVNNSTLGVGLLPPRAALGGAQGERGSKYPFASLNEPTKDADGNVTGYSFFTINLTDVENADEKKLSSAIQAAVAAQNKKHKEKGETTKYVSRTNVDDKGAYTGSSVYRVDDTIGDDE